MHVYRLCTGKEVHGTKNKAILKRARRRLDFV